MTNNGNKDVLPSLQLYELNSESANWTLGGRFCEIRRSIFQPRKLGPHSQYLDHNAIPQTLRQWLLPAIKLGFVASAKSAFSLDISVTFRFPLSISALNPFQSPRREIAYGSIKVSSARHGRNVIIGRIVGNLALYVE